MELLCALLGALVGGSLTIASEFFFRNRDKLENMQHYASILYFDLDSIHRYVEKLRVNCEDVHSIRFSPEWSKAASQCVFLGPEMIRKVYSIYDCIYDFNALIVNKKADGMIAFEKIGFEMRGDSIKFRNLMNRLATYATVH